MHMANSNDQNIVLVHNINDQMRVNRVSRQLPPRFRPLSRRPREFRQKVECSLQSGGVVIGLGDPEQVLASCVYILEIRLRFFGQTIH